jgi:RNA polymerase sigma-70 factor (ECF subfamily)
MIEAPEEFAALMKKVRLGDTNALSQLLTCYEQEVQQAARCLLGRSLRSRLDPSDLVQSVHCTLILGFLEDRFDVPNQEKLVALALTVVRNKVARAARQLRCQQRHNAALVDTASCRMVGTIAPLAESDPASLAEFHDTVERLCAGLNESDRRLVEMRLQGLSTADIARQLGLNADVLRVRLSRLRQHLRQTHNLSDWI